MPWLPELFSAPALQLILDQRRRDALLAVPYFDGLLAGDPEPLVASFVGQPEVHDPVRGRIKGVTAFRGFVAETSAWLLQHHATVGDVEHVIQQRHGFEEVVLHLDTDRGTVDLPVAVVAERQPDGRIDEVRVYFTSRPLTGRPALRPPLLQPDPDLTLPDFVAAYLRAVAVGDVDEVVATFEPDGYVRESVGGQVHRGADGLSAFYTRLFSHGGGIPLEACAFVGDVRGCAVEYNVVRWGTTQLPPQAGLSVFMAGPGGGLAAVRDYGDIEPPLHLET
ncbi:nuclear transport factor 2 family protein [Angustibacter sp. McL0619]|uniref:nuclear transport factor 2 family protein n=1 Tax=Angustibacter sp. McL0619 TaxID=3415676 RepID=UPI003CF98ACB